MQAMKRLSITTPAAVLCTMMLCSGVAMSQNTPNPDPGFGVGGVVRLGFGTGNSDIPNDILLQPNGMIVTAGRSDGADGYFVALSRQFPNGQLDTAGFGVAGKVRTHVVLRDQANAIALQQDGKIIAVGMQAASNAGSAQTPSIYRFNSNGTLDTTFVSSGYVAIRFDGVSSGEFSGVAVRADGKIVAAGRCNAHAGGGANGFGFMRFKTSGVLDSTFGSAGKTRLDFSIDFLPGACAFLQNGGTLLACTAFLNGRTEYVMACVDSLGRRDSTFGTNGIRQTGIEATSNTSRRVATVDGGKFLLAGTTPRTNGNPQFSVFRFHPNGVLDSTFGINGRTDITITSNDKCYGMTIGSEGRILLVGSVSVGFGQTGLARLTAIGTPDTTFAPGGKLISNLNSNTGTHYLTCVRILSDEKILAAGPDFVSGDFMVVRYRFGITGVEEQENSHPAAFTLHQNYPNPFNPSTRIEYALPHPGHVRLTVYNVLGQLVATLVDGERPAGRFNVEWNSLGVNGTVASSGIYFYRVEAKSMNGTASLTSVKKMLLLK